MNGLALCIGGGGLEAALHIVSSRYRTICAVERQTYAAASFVAWMEKTGMGTCSPRCEGQGNGRPTGDGCFAWPWPAGRGVEQYAWEKPRLVESGMGGTAHGVGSRAEQLLCLGNGVVPVAGALAFVALWRELNANG